MASASRFSFEAKVRMRGSNLIRSMMPMQYWLMGLTRSEHTSSGWSLPTTRVIARRVRLLAPFRRPSKRVLSAVEAQSQ